MSDKKKSLLFDIVEIVAVSSATGLIFASLYLSAYLGWIPRSFGIVAPLFTSLLGGMLVGDLKKSLLCGLLMSLSGTIIIFSILTLPTHLGMIGNPLLTQLFVEAVLSQIVTGSGPVKLHIIVLLLFSVLGGIVGSLARALR